MTWIPVLTRDGYDAELLITYEGALVHARGSEYAYQAVHPRSLRSLCVTTGLNGEQIEYFESGLGAVVRRVTATRYTFGPPENIRQWWEDTHTIKEDPA